MIKSSLTRGEIHHFPGFFGGANDIMTSTSAPFNLQLERQKCFAFSTKNGPLRLRIAPYHVPIIVRILWNSRALEWGFGSGASLR